jgi:hypothetical protein
MSRDLTPKEKKDLKEIKEHIEKNSFTPEPKGIGDMIDFNNLYRLKGHEKIWSPVSDVHKSGMVTFVEWLTKGHKKTVHKDAVIKLGHYFFATTEFEPVLDEDGNEQLDKKGKTIERLKRLHISDILNNLNAHFVDVNVDDSTHIFELMEVMCPNFDRDEFKPYHAKQVVKWYNEIKNKILLAEKIEKLKAEEVEHVEQ